MTANERVKQWAVEREKEGEVIDAGEDWVQLDGEFTPAELRSLADAIEGKNDQV